MKNNRCILGEILKRITRPNWEMNSCSKPSAVEQFPVTPLTYAWCSLSCFAMLYCSTDQTYNCLSSKQWFSVLSSRRVQDGHQGEYPITRERSQFSKIHESDCKPSTHLSCSYLSWHVEVSAVPCSTSDRMNERQYDYRNPPAHAPRVNKRFKASVNVNGCV